MSSFLSTKYLRFRAGARAAIAVDTYCTGCGYNVRGLHEGRNCPECGQLIQLTRGAQEDPIATGDWFDRAGMRHGLMLLTIAMAWAIISRIGEFIGLLFISNFPMVMWLAIDAALGVAWALGAWLVTPPRLDHALGRLRPVRLIARWSAPAFAIASVLYAIDVHQQANGPLLFWGRVLELAGWIGCLALAIVLRRLADDAELEDAARRIHLAIWIGAITMALQWLIPDQVPWIIVWVIGLMVLAWCWGVWLMLRGTWAMQRHAAWSMRLAHERQSRQANVDRTRAELDREAARQIRSVPRHSADDPVSID